MSGAATTAPRSGHGEVEDTLESDADDSPLAESPRVHLQSPLRPSQASGTLPAGPIATHPDQGPDAASEPSPRSPPRIQLGIFAIPQLQDVQFVFLGLAGSQLNLAVPVSKLAAFSQETADLGTSDVLPPLQLLQALGLGLGLEGLDAMLQASLLERDPFKKVLSEEGEKQKISFLSIAPSCRWSLAETAPAAGLLVEDLCVGSEVATTPCGHMFSRDAILYWLKSENAICPVCRAPLPSKEVRRTQKRERQPDLTSGSPQSSPVSHPTSVPSTPLRPIPVRRRGE
eukprot:gene11761-2141_t